MKESALALQYHERVSALAADRALGCGNFLHLLAERAAEPTAALIWLDRDFVGLDGERRRSFSPASLKAVVDQYAALYHARGVRPKAPVGVYFEEGIDYFIHYLALAGLGAIPVLVNPAMKSEIAALYLRKVGVEAIFVDAPQRERLLPHLSPAERPALWTADGFSGSVLPEVYPYRHRDDDPVLLCHSSGTTGIPKAVIFTHQGFFTGVREQLKQPFYRGMHRDLSAFPQSHSAGVFRLTLGLLNGFPALVNSIHRAELVLAQIAAFRATRLFAFPQTFVEIAESDLSRHDLGSLRFWINTGDAAHESHIRRLVLAGGGKDGSTFVDAFGSSELGCATFLQPYSRESRDYDRCVGAPLGWAEAVVLDEQGRKLPPGCPGRLGVRSPAVTRGYWNDPLLTARSRSGGYWLTGDIVFQDESGRFYHLDRAADVIAAKAGPVYSVQLEECLQKNSVAIAECTVIGLPTGEGPQAPVAIVRKAEGSALAPSALKKECNRILTAHRHPPVAEVLVLSAESIPVGPTGKVLKRELRERYQDLLVTPRHPFFRIAVLAIGTFAIGTDAFILAGILPKVAADLGVSVAVAGQLVTAFSVSYALGAPLLATLLGDRARKQILVGAMLLFTLANLGAACAASFAAMMLFRMLTAIGAAVFQPTANAVATSLVPPEKSGRALSMVIAGAALAPLVGVPLGTWLAHVFHWRVDYLFAAILGVLAALGCAFGLPPLRPPRRVALRERIGLWKRVPVLLSLLVSTTCLMGVFALYTFLSPLLLKATLLTDSTLGFAFLAYGAGTLVGNALGGIGTDYFGSTRMIVLSVSALAVCFFTLGFMTRFTPSVTTTAIALLSLFAWGALGWMFNPAQAHRLVALEPASAALILSANGTAVHLGISLGSLIGGLVLQSSGLCALGLCAALLQGLCLLLFRFALREKE